MNIGKRIPLWRAGLMALLLVILLMMLPLSNIVAAGEMLFRGGVSSGGTHLSSGDISLHSSVGQPAAGIAAGANITLCSGFNCAAASETPIPTLSPTPVATAPPAGDETLYLPLMRTE